MTDEDEALAELARHMDKLSAEHGRPYAYDRQGNPIGFAEYAKMRSGPRGEDPIRVASTLVGTVWVSTVWLGIDHGWQGRPLIFETMTFSTDGDEHDSEIWSRYSTEEDAHAGHALVVAQLVNELGVEPIEEGDVKE